MIQSRCSNFVCTTYLVLDRRFIFVCGESSRLSELEPEGELDSLVSVKSPFFLRLRDTLDEAEVEVEEEEVGEDDEPNVEDADFVIGLMAEDEDEEDLDERLRGCFVLWLALSAFFGRPRTRLGSADFFWLLNSLDVVGARAGTVASSSLSMSIGIGVSASLMDDGRGDGDG